MAITAQIALSSGVIGPGQTVFSTVTVFNTGAVAVNVLGIQGFLFNSGTQQRAPGANDGYAYGPGFTTAVPSGGSITFNGNVSLQHGQPLATPIGTTPANELLGGNTGGATQPIIAVDALVVVYTSGAGADAQVTSSRATLLYGGALPALAGDGAWDTIKGAYAFPGAAPGQLWFDRTNGFNTALEALLCP